MTYHDMTFTALAKRADEVQILDTVADLLGEGDDLREVTLCFEHEQIGYGDGWKTVGKEIIAVAFCDVDDPLAVPEIITRDDLVALIGGDRVYGLEEVE